MYKVSAPAKDKEEIELLESKEFYLTARYSHWLDLYTDENNKETFGKATVCAHIAYNIPPDRKAYASQIGSVNLKKAKLISREYLTKIGLGLPQMLNVAVSKMSTTNNPKWWTELMEIADYKAPVTPLTQNNTQVNIQQNADPDEVKAWNENFTKFLDAEHDNR